MDFKPPVIVRKLSPQQRLQHRDEPLNWKISRGTVWVTCPLSHPIPLRSETYMIRADGLVLPEVICLVGDGAELWSATVVLDRW